MSKVIVTGVDGNFGGYVARNITHSAYAVLRLFLHK